MFRKKTFGISLTFVFLLGIILTPSLAEALRKKALIFQDIMKFREIHRPIISEDGVWVAYNAQPDRGDGEVIIHDLKRGKVFSVERGDNPVISKDTNWVAVIVKPEALELEKADKKKPKQGMALLETQTGKVVNFEKVQRFSFSDDSKWLAYHHFKEEEKKAEKEKPNQEKEKPETPEKKKKEEKIGTTLVLRHLGQGKEQKISYVESFAFSPSSKYLAYTLAQPEGKGNGLSIMDLSEETLPRNPIDQSDKGRFVLPTWHKKADKLAFLSKPGDSDKMKDSYFLWVWDGKDEKKIQAVSPEDAPHGWMIPEKNRLSWTENGRRLFFGFKPQDDFEEKKEEEKDKQELKESDLFDVEKILQKTEVDVWHWNDPFINPHQKKMWPRVKDRTYLAVYHLDADKVVPLADQAMPVVRIPENPHWALGLSDVPYRREVTWDGRFNDVYTVSLDDGSRKKVVSRLGQGRNSLSLSPEGRFIVYYQDKNWHLYDVNSGSVRNLTESLKIPFFNEDHDYPSDPPGYGLGGWVEDDQAVLIYDKYDIWQFPTKRGELLNLTEGEGREQNTTFRVLRLDREQRFLKKSESLLLSSYRNLKKNNGFFSCRVGRPGVEKRLEEEKKFRVLAKAKKADVLMYTRESYQEFPDIWVSDGKFNAPRKVSDVNPQTGEFAWGSAELVEWKSLDGIPLQGVLIKPGNYESGKRYPVIVYFYRFFSQRLHEFNQTVVNHRPCFPFYASNGYAVFLPDIRFEVGRPGFAATKCIVPGVQKLIDIGIADPEKVGLHGHSWSGYQTAFVITQTDIFAAAIAGAPVSNMTSAYSGIRWGSGLARQFQYEKSQSRIGGSLWEYPERYIENSPVFFADRIRTPLLIMFGDEDGAVPWYQGIELYLAMRRLSKDCIYLVYNNEPHHPQKYANKLDYSIKMKQYFDHYLKGMPAPVWITKGVPYKGE